MPTHSQLAERACRLYWEYSNVRYYKLQFKTVSKRTLIKLIRLRTGYTSTTVIDRPPAPTMRILREEAYDDYKNSMQRFFSRLSIDIRVHELNVPQTEALANFLVGRKHPKDSFYEACYKYAHPAADDRLTQLLAGYACDFYFPVRPAGLRRDTKDRVLNFLDSYTGRKTIRPPLPRSNKLFMVEYYQYRQRAQNFFDKIGFPFKADSFSLAMIEALLNFFSGNAHPDVETYRKVFAASAVRPVEYFVTKFKPYENQLYPISVGQYHGKKDQITPLLFFKPVEYIKRWFEPPASNKIQSRRRRRLYLNYRVIFERFGIQVDPNVLPIAYIEALLNFAQALALSARGTKQPSRKEKSRMALLSDRRLRSITTGSHSFSGR